MGLDMRACRRECANGKDATENDGHQTRGGVSGTGFFFAKFYCDERLLRTYLHGTQRYEVIYRTDEDALTREIVALASEYGRYGYPWQVSSTALVFLSTAPAAGRHAARKSDSPR